MRLIGSRIVLRARIVVALFVLSAWLSGCETTSSHQFGLPSSAWQTRTGQLAYRGSRIALIGEVLVRTSKAGEMELIFSKGPGVTLMVIRQDAQFASAEGTLARGRWTGPTSSAPVRLRGWFALRENIIAGRTSARVTTGEESFDLRF